MCILTIQFQTFVSSCSMGCTVLLGLVARKPGIKQPQGCLPTPLKGWVWSTQWQQTGSGHQHTEAAAKASLQADNEDALPCPALGFAWQLA